MHQRNNLLFYRMGIFTIFLRAVNVGGTGKLPMADLKSICFEIGCSQVITYIQSGNVVVETSEPQAKLKAKLEARLAQYAARPIGIVLRTAAELAEILAYNPFKDQAPNRVITLLFDELPKGPLDNVKNQKDEIIAIGQREIYVQYGEGMGTSRLIIPAAKIGTGRNINTLNKMLELAQQMETQE